MAGVNSVHLVGNLGRDPEVKYTTSGLAICNFSLAINEKKKDGDKWVEHTEWVNVVAFGKTAENIGQYLAKGRQLFVEGRMQTRKWTDKNKIERYSTEVVADKVVFLGSGGDGKGASSSRPSSSSSAPPLEGELVEDDLPF